MRNRQTRWELAGGALIVIGCWVLVASGNRATEQQVHQDINAVQHDVDVLHLRMNAWVASGQLSEAIEDLQPPVRVTRVDQPVD